MDSNGLPFGHFLLTTGNLPGNVSDIVFIITPFFYFVKSLILKRVEIHKSQLD
jgi:hypothetical protein